MNEHVEMVRQVLHKSVEWLGERRGIIHTRRHLAVSFKGLENFRNTKIEMLRSESMAEIDAILDRIKHDYADFIYHPAPENSDEQ